MWRKRDRTQDCRGNGSWLLSSRQMGATSGLIISHFTAGANSKQCPLPSLSFLCPDTLTFPSHPEPSPNPPVQRVKLSPEPGAACRLEAAHSCTFAACPPSTSWLRAESHMLLGPLGLSWAESQGTRRERPPLQCPQSNHVSALGGVG